ncbi:MAG TPA: DUF4440 domain-containing protein [Gammaproteobacteria bacterium]|nr:DUF4440 domain-containing protein [Gammaproteobacteria bacterium]
MKTTILAIAVFLTALSLPGCQRHMQADAAQTRILLNTDQAFSATSVQNGFAAAFTRYAQADATFLPQGGEALKGARQIAQSLAGIPAGTKISWTPQAAEVSGDLGYTWGIYTSTGTNGSGQATVAYGKYVSIWNRQNGDWKLSVMMINQSPGPAG